LGKRTCGNESDESDDVPLSKKVRPNTCADNTDAHLLDRDPPLINGNNEETQS